MTIRTCGHCGTHAEAMSWYIHQAWFCDDGKACNRRKQEREAIREETEADGHTVRELLWNE